MNSDCDEGSNTVMIENNSVMTPNLNLPGKGNNKEPRNHTRSSSSSSSSDSSSSSSSTSHDKRKSRRRRHKKRGGKYKQRRDILLNKLSREVSELNNRVNSYNGSRRNIEGHTDDCFIDDNVSGVLYCESPQNALFETGTTVSDSFQPNVIFEIETKLKEPSIPKASQDFLTILKDVQHFNSNEWSEVRYSEVQKSYNHTPGFIDLEVNDEVKGYDTLKHLSNSDKAYAALTYCVLKQREALQTALKQLLRWSQNSNLTPESLKETINDFFLKGDLCQVTSDLLQLICGHRAEIIQMRRDAIINSVRDPVYKSALRKIPPSCNHIFDSESLVSLLEKTGGVRKMFVTNKHYGNVANTVQRNSNRSSSTRHPPQGQAMSSLVPPQGTLQGCCASSHIPLTRQPAQGCSYSRPPPGQRTYNAEPRSSLLSHSRGTFRPRGARGDNRGKYHDKTSRKRAASPSSYGATKKCKF